MPLQTTRKKPTVANTLYCRKKGLEATGQRSVKGFLVFKNSQATVPETGSISDNIRAARAKLVEKGVLVSAGDTYEFTCDYECSSPSFASSIVRGGALNGLLDWKNKDGKTLKEIEA